MKYIKHGYVLGHTSTCPPAKAALWRENLGDAIAPLTQSEPRHLKAAQNIAPSGPESLRRKMEQAYARAHAEPDRRQAHKSAPPTD